MTIQIELPYQRLESNSTVVSLIALFVGIVGISLTGIFIKASEQELGPWGTVFDSMMISSLVFLLWDGISGSPNQKSDPQIKEKSTYTIGYFLLLLALGTFSAVSTGLQAWSLTHTNIANSTLLRNMSPLFTCLGGWLLLGQRFDNKFLIGMGIALGGVIAVGLADLQVAAEHLTGDIAALVSAIFYAATILVMEQMRQNFSASNIMLWRCLLRCLLVLPIVLVTEDSLFPSSWSGWLAVICLALICHSLGQGLMVYGLKQLSSGFVSLSLLFAPVLAAVIAWLIFSENLTLLNWLAFPVILAGIHQAQSSQSIYKNN